jgi:hypothetical protein
VFKIKQLEKTPVKDSSKQKHTRKFIQQTTVIVALVFAIGIIFTTTTPAYAQAITSTERISGPVDGFVSNSCNGEDVKLSGNVNIVIHVTQDASGGFHIVSGHTNFQGVTGIGESTGDKYIFAGGVNPIQNIREGSVNESTFLAHGRLISQGNQANQLATTQFHVTFNANGEITAEIDSFSFKCT